MKLGFLLLVLLMVTIPLAVRSQQSSFTVAGIKPFDKAVPGQVMDVLIEGLNSDAAPGNVKFTIENFDGERYSTPVTKSFVLTPRQ